MATPLIWTACALALVAVALNTRAEELVKNGDVSSGPAHWKGDRTVSSEEAASEDDKPNKVLEVRADPHRIRSFSQSIRTRGLKDVAVSFRYKADPSYSGRGITIRMHRTDRSNTFYDRSITADGAWHTIRFNFGEIRGSNTIEFLVEVKEGEGVLHFDDFSIQPK